MKPLTQNDVGKACRIIGMDLVWGETHNPDMDFESAWTIIDVKTRSNGAQFVRVSCCEGQIAFEISARKIKIKK